MKKITFIFTLLICSLGYSQTYSLYTEDATISAGSGVPTFFNNVEGYTEVPSTAAYEGSNARKFVFNNTSSWFMCQVLHSNTTYGEQDLSAFSYYNVAIKTTSKTSFYIRMKGNNVTSKILFTDGSDPYGFARDGQWHLMSIPFTDFVPESASFDISKITELFVLRSNGTLDTANNDFEFDHFYMSTTNQTLGVKTFETAQIGMYPNPANTEINLKSKNKIDSIVIYNITGQKVLESNVTEQLNISSLKSGMYFIKAISDGVSSTSKFIKE